MKKKISSNAAPLHKSFWIFFFFVLGITLLVTDASLLNKTGYFIIWIICFTVFWKLYRNLRTVEVDDSFIYVSDGAVTLKIPFSEIKNIREEFIDFRNPIIFIDLKNETQFGHKIKFMPYFVRRWLPKPHPVINQIKQLTKLTNQKTISP